MSPTRVIRAAERTHWRGEGIHTRQSMPFTGKFDLGANAHGQLLVHNDDLIDPGSGVDRHFHRDAEIVTYVVSGEVHHDDSSGARGVVRAGEVQSMSAGSGVTHREQNPRRTGAVTRAIQMWLPPNRPGGEPLYRTAEVGSLLTDEALVTVASGIAGHRPAVLIDNDAAALHAARRPAGGSVVVPDAPYGQLFIVSGIAEVSGERLTEGDVLRTRAAGELTVEAIEPVEILYWEMYAQAASAL